MLRHTLVPALVLLSVLAAPPLGAASAEAAGPRSDEPGGLAAALAELRELAASLWPPLSGGLVHRFDADGAPQEPEGEETGDPGGLQGAQDPNGLQAGQDPNGGQELPADG